MFLCSVGVKTWVLNRNVVQLVGRGGGLDIRLIS